jgi:hypothetical protein
MIFDRLPILANFRRVGKNSARTLFSGNLDLSLLNYIFSGTSAEKAERTWADDFPSLEQPW